MLVKCETKKSLKGIAFCRLGTHIGDTLCHLCVTRLSRYLTIFFSPLPGSQSGSPTADCLTLRSLWRWRERGRDAKGDPY